MDLLADLLRLESTLKLIPLSAASTAIRPSFFECPDQRGPA
jgi:hypothetical protein